MAIPKPLRFLLRTAIDVIVVTSVILFIPGIPPFITFEAFTLTPARPFEGKLALNNKLSAAKPLLEDQILGPESIAVRGSEVYTGIIGGEVIRLKGNGDEYDVIAHFGKPCEGQWEEAKCGRPLGMRFAPGNNATLIVADAYYGLFSVNVDTKEVQKLVSIDAVIDGKAPKNPNDLDIAKDGKIYWSDSSTNVFLQDATIEFFGEPSGRLLQYDPKTMKTTVLMKNLHFANGVQLSNDESFVLVSETAKSRVLRYYLSGPYKGQSDVFIDGLPGSPDNIRSDRRGRIYISLVAPRYSTKRGIMDILGPHPYVRKFLLRLMCVVKSFLSLIQSVGSVEFVDKAQYWLGHLELAASLFPRHAIVLEVDQKGNIIGSFQSAEGKVASVSELTFDADGKYAYMGSPYNKKIWKISSEFLQSSRNPPELNLG